MDEERKENSDSCSTAPEKPTPSKTFEVLKKCRCNSDSFHSLDAYYITDVQQDDEVSSKIIVKKIVTDKGGSTPEGDREEEI